MNQSNNMLAVHKQEILTELVTSSSKEELLWINGFIAGLLNGKELPETVTPTAFLPRLTLVYGTETGNSKRIATEFAAKAKKRQFPVKLASLEQYRLSDLSKEENLCVVISTQGDGEPPIAAQKFYDHIHHNGFRLDKLTYSVLALGDSSYPMFCKTGEDVDAQLQKLGGKRLVPIRKCDIDFETDANDWFEEVLKTVQNRPGNLQAGLPLTKTVAETKTGKKIYHANILNNIKLTDRGSSQEIRHMEIQASEVDYEPGDSVGIVPENPLSTVNEIIRLTGIDPGKKLDFKDGEHTVQVLLHKKLAITHLHERVVKKYAGIVQEEIPETKADLKALLELYPVKNAAMFEEVIQTLPAQSPRIYTIASSISVNRDEVHLTVEEDRFMVNGLKHTGLCSGYLSALEADDNISFFVQKNKRFRLPAKDRDIIMIGSGTGIAAFR
jgi:sulfite reductase (NADPH) flavoprotein alpha-component